MPTNRAPLDLRLTSAVTAGKLARLMSRQLGLGGGSSLPGLLTARFDPLALGKLVRGLPRGSILVSGTNGKTTTSRLFASILHHAGWHPVHNRTGANMTSGLIAALLDGVDLTGRSRADSALFEVDEAVLASIRAEVRPRVIVLTNLFRDQLDRYGEIDYVAHLWERSLTELSADTTVVLNGDDPALAALGQRLTVPVLYYGLDLPGAAAPDRFADSKNCPLCGSPLEYRAVHYAHLGDYACPNQDFRRPALDIAARSCEVRGIDATRVEVTGPFGTRQWDLQVPGLFNVYNLLAAVAGATTLGIPIAAIDRAVAGFQAVFGRFERLTVNDRTIFFTLVKNPVGLTEVLRTILTEPGEKGIVGFLNDNLADGTDVSWLWDAEVELLAQRCQFAVVGGTRVGDLAVRLKYAGVPSKRIHPVESIADGLDAGLERTPPGGTLYILPTYTAMLELRALASKRGYASRYWEN